MRFLLQHPGPGRGAIAICAIAAAIGIGGAGAAFATTEPISCEADSCQPLPPPPVDPALTTTIEGPGNGPVRYHRICRPGFSRRHGKCVRRHSRRHRHGQRRGGTLR